MSLSIVFFLQFSVVSHGTFQIGGSLKLSNVMVILWVSSNATGLSFKLAAVVLDSLWTYIPQRLLDIEVFTERGTSITVWKLHVQLSLLVDMASYMISHSAYCWQTGLSELVTFMRYDTYNEHHRLSCDGWKHYQAKHYPRKWKYGVMSRRDYVMNKRQYGEASAPYDELSNSFMTGAQQDDWSRLCSDPGLEKIQSSD